MSNNIKRVKDLKELINKVMLPNYSYKTNFSSASFKDLGKNVFILEKLQKNILIQYWA